MSDTEDGFTPVPGTPLPEGEAERVHLDFRDRFRHLREGQDPSVPTWSAFPEGAKRSSLSILATLPASTEVLFLFDGNGRSSVWTTRADDILQYLTGLEPWEDRDMYVLDPNLMWCVAYTHPQMGETRLVIVAGSLPVR